jgi:hypothetical protein
MTSFTEHLSEKLKDPEFKKLYEQERASLQKEYLDQESKEAVAENKTEERIAL